VTVVGPITGTVEGKIGSTPYKFMTMQVNGYKRWRLEQQVIMPPSLSIRGCGAHIHTVTAIRDGAGITQVLRMFRPL
jgi:outer membrane lipoprotein